MNVDLPPAARRWAAGTLVVGLPALVLVWIWWTTVPQIGGDDAVIDTVDALFTAVTSHDARRLGQCEEQLRVLQEGRRLPRGAADYLDEVIRTARAGKWRNAAERLFAFMKAQRREPA